MAEYYAVLKKAVGGLDSGSAEARRAVYDKARNALIGQLKAIDPPLAASEISRQRLELEEAIRRVERETVAETQGERYQRSPEGETAPSTAPDPAPPPPAGHPSPQDVFRRAIQEAESRGAAALNSVERAPARGGGSPGGYAPDMGPAGGWTPAGRPEYRSEARPVGGDARLAPDYDNDWQSRDAAARMPANPYLDRDDRRRQTKRKGYAEEDEGELLERTTRRSRLPTILLVVLILGMMGGLAALAWSQRTVIADLVAGFDSGPAEETIPDATATVPSDGPSAKSDDRLPDGGDAGSPVRTVGESEDGVSQLPDAIAEAITGAPAGGDALVAQKAVLYEEPLDAATAAAGVTAINATVTWRFVENGAAGAEIEANVEIPERAMKVRLAIRRNIDPTLPASHLVEAVIDTPADFPGRGIRSIPRLVLKLNEDERGQPLVGASAKVADGFFWIALSATDTDVALNLQLLRERLWIDLPIVYESGQRAILTFEKGAPGQRVFEQALAAWSTG